nr:MAG TPA: hypothetical protein [Caudoviricetes sp.]
MLESISAFVVTACSRKAFCSCRKGSRFIFSCTSAWLLPTK